MSEEELKIIENTINENKDYREHFHLHDYFEVEYIDKLVTSYKQLQQENKQLKEQVQDLKADYGTIAQIERDLYKEVIEEVREYAKSHFKTMAADEEAQGLLQILDKAKENKQYS